MVKHTQTICWVLPTNSLSVFDHFVGLALKELGHRYKDEKLLLQNQIFLFKSNRNHDNIFIHKLAKTREKEKTVTANKKNKFKR